MTTKSDMTCCISIPLLTACMKTKEIKSPNLCFQPKARKQKLCSTQTVAVPSLQQLRLKTHLRSRLLFISMKSRQLIWPQWMRVTFLKEKMNSPRCFSNCQRYLLYMQGQTVTKVCLQILSMLKAKCLLIQN